MNTVKRLSLLVDNIYQVILGVERNPKPKRARKKAGMLLMINQLKI